jgi:hypothetical protein
MRSVTYSMSVSLDGYIVGPDGDLSFYVSSRATRIRHELPIDDVGEPSLQTTHGLCRVLPSARLRWR